MQLLLQYYQGWILRLLHDFLLRIPGIDLRINIQSVQLCGKHRCNGLISESIKKTSFLCIMIHVYILEMPISME